MKVEAKLAVIGFAVGIAVSLGFVAAVMIAYPAPKESPVVPSSGATEARGLPSGKIAPARPSPALVFPKIGWIKDREQGLVIATGGSSVFPLTPNKWGYVHYGVAATEPVNISIVECPDVGDKILIRAFNNALNTEGDFIFDPKGSNVVLLVQDAREPQRETLNAVIGAAIGNKEAAKRLSAQNRVTVTFFKWGCTANCEVQP